MLFVKEMSSLWRGRRRDRTLLVVNTITQSCVSTMALLSSSPPLAAPSPPLLVDAEGVARRAALSVRKVPSVVRLFIRVDITSIRLPSVPIATTCATVKRCR